MDGRAERIVSEYNEHLEMARRESAAARKVVIDAVNELKGLFSGMKGAFDEHSRLHDEVRLVMNDWDPMTPGVGRCADLARIADGLENLKWYMDDMQAEISDGENGGDVFLIRGWREWHGDCEDAEVEIPVEMLDMGKDDIEGLYTDAIEQATKEIEEADEKAKVRAEERERRHYLELKAKYEGTGDTEKH